MGKKWEYEINHTSSWIMSSQQSKVLLELKAFSPASSSSFSFSSVIVSLSSFTYSPTLCGKRGGTFKIKGLTFLFYEVAKGILLGGTSRWNNGNALASFQVLVFLRTLIGKSKNTLAEPEPFQSWISPISWHSKPRRNGGYKAVRRSWWKHIRHCNYSIIIMRIIP